MKPKTHDSLFTNLLPRDITILVGAYNLSNPYEIGRTPYSPLEIKVHDDWNPNVERYDADIAVLILDEDVHFSRYISPICIWNSTTHPEAHEGFVVGWGRDEIHGNTPRELKAPIIDNEDCFLSNVRLAEISSKRTFCAGSANGTGVCHGDGGSGFFIKHNKIFYLHGIVSASLMYQWRCDVTNYAVFTSIAKFTLWIESIVNSGDVNMEKATKDDQESFGMRTDNVDHQTTHRIAHKITDDTKGCDTKKNDNS